MAGEVILIVDGTPAEGLHLEQVLQRLGYRVTAQVSDGSAAFTAIAEVLPDLALVDIRLPGTLSGLELTQQLKDRFSLPVVLLTHADDELSLVDVKPAVPVDLLLLPIPDYLLHIQVESTLMRHRSECEMVGRVQNLGQVRNIESSAQLFKDSIEISKDGAYWMDVNGRFIYVNHSGCDDLGYSQEEMLHLTVFDINPKVTVEVWEGLWQKLRETGFFAKETIHRRKDGSVFPAEVIANRVIFENKEYINGFARDISERKRAECALKEALETQEAIFEGSRDAIFISDKDSRFVAVNQAACKLTGYPREQLLLMRIPDLHDQPDRDAYTLYHQRILSGEEISTEAKILRHDGTKIDSEFSNKRVSIAGQFFMHTTARDISERKRAEEKLHENQWFLDRAQEIAHLGHWNLDPKTNTVDGSDEFLRILGMEKAEFSFPSFTATIDSTQRDAVVSTIATSIALKTRYDIEYSLNCKAGTRKVVHAIGEPVLDDRGECVQLIGTVQDITDRKMSELALLESEARYRSLFEESSISILEEDFSSVKTYLDQLQSSGIHNFRSYLEDHPEVVRDCANRIRIIDINQETLRLFRAESKNDFPHHPDKVFTQATYIHLREVLIALVEGNTRFRVEAETVSLRGETVKFLLNYTIVSGHEDTWDRIFFSFFDITERQLAEDALRESEARFRGTFDRSPIGAAIVSKDFRFTRINDSLGRILGYAPEELVGRTFADVTHPDHIQDDMVQVKRLLASEIDQYVTDKRYLRKDGSVTWAHLSVSLIRDDTGAPLYFLPMVEDINDRKIAEEALRESQYFIQKIIDSSPSLIFIFDLERQIITFANHEVFNSLGYSPADLEKLGPNLLAAILHPDDAHLVNQHLQRMRAAQDGDILEDDYRVKHANGEWRWLRSRDIPFGRNAKGEVKLVLSSALDITERKRVDEKIIEANTRLKLALDAARAGTWDWNIVTNSFYWSPELFTLFGADRTTLPGFEVWAQAVHPDDRDQAARLIQHAIETHTDLVSEYRVIHSDGETRWIRATGRVTYDGSKPLRMTGICLDITESKLAATEIIASEARYRQLYEQSPLPYQSLDRNGIILEVNQAWLKTLKYSRDEVIDKYFGMILGENSQVQYRDIHEEAMHSGEIYNEFEIRQADGGTLLVAIDGVVVKDQHNQPVRIQCVLRDITASRKTEELIRASEETLRRLALHLQEAREQERLEVARTIHDELGQALSVLEMDLTWLERHLPRLSEPNVRKMKSMHQLIDATTHMVQRISRDLRPALLDDLGIFAAIDWHVKDFANRSGIKCNLVTQQPTIPIDLGVSTAVFRILQEALTNVARHAGATRVNVAVNADEKALTLSVKDNGQGITEAELVNPHSLGIIGIRERAYALGGEVSITRGPRRGTIVKVSIPLTRKEGSHDQGSSV